MCDGYYRVAIPVRFRFVINHTRVVAGSLRRFHLFSGTQKCPQSYRTSNFLRQI